VKAVLRRRVNLLIGIPLGLLIGLVVAFFVVISSGRDTPTFSTTGTNATTGASDVPSQSGPYGHRIDGTSRTAPPASGEPGAPGPSGRRR
jgi:hypothetical protein